MPSKIQEKTTKQAVKTVAEEPKKKAPVKAVGVDIDLFSLDGKKKGTLTLPKTIFGAKVNEPLMLQAIRVYLVNQRQGTANTKTRGEVRGSTRKIYRQKGTGRARHGGITAPIFVGGGIALGPRSRNFELKMSKQMRKKALFSALSQKVNDSQVIAVESGSLSGKTKEAFNMLKALNTFKKNKADKVLFITGSENASRAIRNIDGVTILPPHTLNVFEVMNSKFLILGNDAVSRIEEVFLGESKEN